ncbi:hypothetical protein [Burkholderia ambifaria]|uniref:hypothetical protein n=1 Tax=Burkholderia ambifaria TaxID=152480 RepID=UPI0005BD3CFD|nr:hypothetical protein [Burkholderia ambifaria]
MVKLLSKCAVNAVLVVRVVRALRFTRRGCALRFGLADRLPPCRGRTGGHAGCRRRPGQNTASDAFVMSVISM